MDNEENDVCEDLEVSYCISDRVDVEVKLYLFLNLRCFQSVLMRVAATFISSR